MFNFQFKNPTKLIFGKGQIEKAGREIPADAKVMMTYGGGSIKKNGVYDQVKKSLAGHDMIEFGGIEANPKYETLIKAVELAKKEGVDYLLAVGGGSVIDGTKYIALAMNYTGSDPWEIVIDPKTAASITPVPFGTVLTLPATGSEMNNGAVVSRIETQEKYAVKNPDNYPQFSILDPEVCYTLPKRQIINGVIDTYVHVMEQYLTTTNNSMVMDRFAEGVLLTLMELAPKLEKDSRNYDTMANFMLSATMGLNGFLAMGVPQDWATHMIGHELTALKGLDHGLTLALVAPSLYNVMRGEKHDKLLQYGERVFGITKGNDEERIDEAIARTRGFFESLGVKCSLSANGVDKETCDAIVGRFRERDARLGENGTVTADVVKRILEEAY